MKKRSLLLGLSLMTAVSPVSLLAGPGHGNEEHSEGFFTRLKNAVFEGYGEQLPFGRVGKSSEVSKKVAIELNDQFRFSPEVIPVAVGETLQLDFKNADQMRHEWVIGTPFKISEHLELMRRSRIWSMMNRTMFTSILASHTHWSGSLIVRGVLNMLACCPAIMKKACVDLRR